MKRLNKLVLAIASLSILAACSDDDDMGTPIAGEYQNGIFVSGEGSGSVMGNISFVSNDFATTEQQVYQNVNNEDLGVYLQSMSFNEDNAYIVVDAGTVTVTNRYTMEKEAAITSGLTLPRYMTFANGKGYISDWGNAFDETDDYIAVVNLESYTVETTIPVGNGPEQLVVSPNGNKLFVSHKGAYSTNNIVSVISTTDDSVITTIEVEDNPDEMVITDSNQLVVLSEGNIIYDEDWQPTGYTNAALSVIDMNSNTLVSATLFDEGDQPSLMAYNNGNVYYVLNGGVYIADDSISELSDYPMLLLEDMNAYGFAVNDEYIFIANASFTGQSELVVYNAAAYTEVESFTAPVAASKIYFNN